MGIIIHREADRQALVLDLVFEVICSLISLSNVQWKSTPEHSVPTYIVAPASGEEILLVHLPNVI